MFVFDGNNLLKRMAQYSDWVVGDTRIFDGSEHL